jgi:hypothetical protein
MGQEVAYVEFSYNNSY